MNKDKEYIGNLLSDGTTFSWRKVQGQPCVHTFKEDVFYNLCLYKDSEGVENLSINIDDFSINQMDAMNVCITEKNELFKPLKEIYLIFNESCIIVQAA